MDHIPEKARLYFELHITCEAGVDFDKFCRIANRISWRASRFDEDHVDDYNGKWFASARVNDRETMYLKLRSAIDAFTKAGCEVIRWKAEDTLLDSKYGDTL